MTFDVTLCGDIAVGKKPAGIPDGWPGFVDVSPATPVVAPAIRMTQAQLDAQRATNQSAYDAWLLTFLANAAVAETARQNANEPDLANFRDAAAQAVTDNNTYLAIGSPSNAQVVAQVRLLTQENNRLIKSMARIIAKLGVI